MGTSRPSYLEEYCQFILKHQPKSILDLGVGFGKNGFLAREYTDIWNGRIHMDSWLTKIDGVEIHRPYISGIQTLVYDKILVGDIRSMINFLIGNYDLIVMTDVLEHFEKDEGIKLMEQISQAPQLFVTTPIYPSAQGEVNGNVYETHRSQFTKDELSKYGKVITEGFSNTFIVYKE